MPKTAICLRVPKLQGEAAIALVGKLEIIDRSLAIKQEDAHLCVPLTREPTANEIAAIPQATLQTAIFNEKIQATTTLNEALKGKLPAELLGSVPQAFDIIGDIVVIDVPPALKAYERVIGEAVMQTHKSVKTVLSKAGDIGGVFRVREYRLLAGEDRTRTVHREFGCTYHVDLAKAYFSPRLSHEHERVASQVQSGEAVVDLFAGVGPFAVLIGKRHFDVKVYAVDLNPEAVELLKVNVRVNRVDSRVVPLCADARTAAAGKLKNVADRVIMNLPETAIDFVDAACNALKPGGGVVHFYGFVRAPDCVENLKGRFSELVESNGRKVAAFQYAKSIRETAPFESQVVLDAKIV